MLTYTSFFGYIYFVLFYTLLLHLFILVRCIRPSTDVLVNQYNIYWLNNYYFIINFAYLVFYLPVILLMLPACKFAQLNQFVGWLIYMSVFIILCMVRMLVCAVASECVCGGGGGGMRLE